MGNPKNLILKSEEEVVSWFYDRNKQFQISELFVKLSKDVTAISIPFMLLAA
jgi:hypothetical protein